MLFIHIYIYIFFLSTQQSAETVTRVKMESKDPSLETRSSRPRLRFTAQEPARGDIQLLQRRRPNVQPMRIRLRNRNFENNAARRISPPPSVYQTSPPPLSLSSVFEIPTISSIQTANPLVWRGINARTKERRRGAAVVAIVAVIVSVVEMRGEERRRRY